MQYIFTYFIVIIIYFFYIYFFNFIPRLISEVTTGYFCQPFMTLIRCLVEDSRAHHKAFRISSLNLKIKRQKMISKDKEKSKMQRTIIVKQESQR